MSIRKNTHFKNFESTIAELEATVAKMESGQLPLDQSLEAYQRGIELVRYCRQTLTEVEQQISLLDDSDTLQTYPAKDE